MGLFSPVFTSLFYLFGWFIRLIVVACRFLLLFFFLWCVLFHQRFFFLRIFIVILLLRLVRGATVGYFRFRLAEYCVSVFWLRACACVCVLFLASFINTSELGYLCLFVVFCVFIINFPFFG